MKKKFLCLLMILMIAFSFAACDMSGKGASNAGTDPDSDAFKEKCIAPDFGEKGYEEHFYKADCVLDDDETPREALLTSVSELNQFHELLKVSERYPNETEGKVISNKLKSYSTDYFEENALIVIFRDTSSGSNWFTVKNVETDENTVNVTLQYWETLMGTCDMKYWSIFIECPKGEVDTLNVVTQTKKQQQGVSGVGLYICLTHEVSLDTIYSDFTSEDFSELEFEFTVEDFSADLRDKVRQLLVEEPEDYWNRDTVNRYTRTLVIKLTVENKDNVLRAVELLSQREDVKWAEPIYEYFFELD